MIQEQLVKIIDAAASQLDIARSGIKIGLGRIVAADKAQDFLRNFIERLRNMQKLQLLAIADNRRLVHPRHKFA